MLPILAQSSEILTLIISLLTLIFTAVIAVALWRIKAWFYKWLAQFNLELEERFVSTRVYEIQHPGTYPQTRMHQGAD
jgi:hypothetical protein